MGKKMIIAPNLAHKIMYQSKSNENFHQLVVVI